MHKADRDLALSATVRQGVITTAFAVVAVFLGIVGSPLASAVKAALEAAGIETASAILSIGVGLSKFGGSSWAVIKTASHLLRVYDAIDKWIRLARLHQEMTEVRRERLRLQKELRELPEWDKDRKDDCQLSLEDIVKREDKILKRADSAIDRLLVLSNEDPIELKVSTK